TFGSSEFVLQIHSYDSTSSFQSDVIVSGGGGVFPSLPIYDLSSRHHDLINNLPLNIPIAGNYEQNQENTVVNYIATAGGTGYSSYTPLYFADNGQTYYLDRPYGYWGYTSCPQFLFTRNYCDSFVFRNWVHVEMREAPHYSDDIRKYYNWDPITETIDWNRRYEPSIEYNSHWINSLAEVLPDVLNREDGNVCPTACTPLEFGRETQYNRQLFNIEMRWEVCDDFNFHEYRIEIASDSTFSDAELFCQPIENILQTSYVFDHSLLNQLTWFRVKTYDYDGNYSISNKIFIDSEYEMYSYACQPAVSYQIQVDNSEPYINVLVENKGNRSFQIYEIVDLDAPFYSYDFETAVTLQSCSIISFKVYVDTSVPGSYTDTFQLRLWASNTVSLEYSISAIVPEFENIYSKAEIINTNNGVRLIWQGKDEPDALYDVLYCNKPDGEFQVIGTTQNTDYPINPSGDCGFYKVISHRDK
ncbi:MAG: hypothetical protein JXR56_03140, partial [Candidatus Cloacimonetes bacterium]|nr:hypothetical protein [Candidatus Cloacimonadota bacterium]